MASEPRILFYCHNLFGLGHIRRSTRIAEACASRGARCQIVTGCRRLDALKWDDRLELKRLPALEMGPDQQLHEAGYPDRTNVMVERAEEICRVCREFSPDILVVDYLPGGLGGELLPLGAKGSPLESSCQVILGVPYTKRISRPQSRPKNPRIRRWMDRFTGVIAYTDPRWEDPLKPLEPGGLPQLQFYSGFITGEPAKTDPSSREVVVLAGGGREAIVMAPLVRRSLGPLVRNGDITLRCVVGPLGELEAVDIATIVPTGSVEEAVSGARVIVARCGYNSSYTLLRAEAPVVFLPQISPCFEQLDRADGLKKIDRVAVVREDSEDAEAELSSAVAEAMRQPHGARKLPFTLDGAERAAGWLFDQYESTR
mgnify:FL=1